MSKKSREIQEEDDVLQLSSDTKNSKKSKELEQANNKKMQADIQVLTDTVANLKTSHEADNWDLDVSLRNLGNDVGTKMSMLRSTAERQDHQEQ
jgi:hypothetical protein